MFFGRNDAKAETPVLWPPHAKSWLIGKDSDAGRDWGKEEKGTTEDEMAGWHHGLNGHESQWTPGVGDGQGGLACCDPWGRKVGHDWATELNWTELNWNKDLEGLFYTSDLHHPFTALLLTQDTHISLCVCISTLLLSWITSFTMCSPIHCVMSLIINFVPVFTVFASLKHSSLSNGGTSYGHFASSI